MKDSVQPAVRSVPSESDRIRRGAVAVFLLLALGAGAAYARYSLESSCEVAAVKESSALLVRQRDSYDHSYQFATSTSRAEVVRPAAELQQILMDTGQVSVPVCLQKAKSELVDYMGAVVRAFQAYGAGEADSTVGDLLDQAQLHYDGFTTELESVNRCAPFCLPR